MASRNAPLMKARSALLVIDLQKGLCVENKGYHYHPEPRELTENEKYFFGRLKQETIPSASKLIRFCKEHHCEVIYTYVENLTQDGRDRSLDYKLSGDCFNFPKGCEESEILDELKPSNPSDTIMLPKTACSVFNSTNIEYVLRNLGVSQLAVCGIVTNKCVESAVRDAADKGFLVSLVEDCTATNDGHHVHDMAVQNMRGFSRIVNHNTIIDEILKWH